MRITLGIDTGGTYTDAVLLRDGRKVLASAKALTTRQDLALGIGRAIENVLQESAIKPACVKLVCLSTTLATNALVERKGGRIALVFIGFSRRDLARQGLAAALGDEPVIFLRGGHDHTGSEAAPLDLDALHSALLDLPAVSGFAIVSQFATLNPAHERAVRDAIFAYNAAPCSCSFELSSKLGGPKRALTAVFNARLIGMIDDLITRAQTHLRNIGIDAPLMVVRGDGALIDAAEAKRKPIETILSGPAASVKGAKWLSKQSDAIVSDIGGTTTDIAILHAGEPQIDPDGALVGGFRTMVEAVAIHTYGLGGDSQVHLQLDSLLGGLRLGPRRVLPIALLARDYPALVHGALDAQLAMPSVAEFDGRFLLRQSGQSAGLAPREQALLDRLGDAPAPFGDVVQSRLELGAVERLIARGLLAEAALSPSDAAHHLGQLDSWDGVAATKALALWANHRNGAGDAIAADADDLAQQIIDRLTHQSVQILLEVAFDKDTIPGSAGALANHALTRAGLAHHSGQVKMTLALNKAIVAVGAGAGNYYPAIAKRLGTRLKLSKHAGVGNAIGAVVGQIIMREQAKIEAAGEGVFRAFHQDGPCDYECLEAALSALRKELEARARARAKSAGGVGVVIQCEQQITEAEIEGRTTFIAANLRVSAVARPGIAP